MNVDQLREYCLAKPDVEESLPFGPDVIVFKTNGKIFMLLPLDTPQPQFNVKCNPDKAIELREEYNSVQPGFHMNKKHWNTITVDGSVSSALVKEWINDSYTLVRKKKRNTA